MDVLTALYNSTSPPMDVVNTTSHAAPSNCTQLEELCNGNSPGLEGHSSDDDGHHDFIPWDNPDNIITRETLHLIEQVVTCGFNPVLLAVGIPVNILTAIAFARQGLKDRMNLCLFSLALVDMANIFLCFLTGSSNLLENLSPQVRFWWKWTIRKYCRGLHAAFMFSSGCLTMVVAVERCVCVTWPMKTAHLMKTRTMAIIIVFVVVFLNLLSLVYLSHYIVVGTTDPATGETMYELVPTAFYTEYKTFVDFMHSTIITITVPFTSFSVVSIATLITVITLKRAIAWRETSAANSSNVKSQINLVRMLVVISVIYIITATPHIALAFARLLVPDFSFHGRYRNIFVATHVIPLSISAFNSSVNFFVYFKRSSRFRSELSKMFPMCASRGVSNVAGKTQSSTKMSAVSSNHI